MKTSTNKKSKPKSCKKKKPLTLREAHTSPTQKQAEGPAGRRLGRPIVVVFTMGRGEDSRTWMTESREGGLRLRVSGERQERGRETKWLPDMERRRD